MNLKPNEQLWVRNKWALIRKSQQMADKANNEWTELNAALNDKMDAEGVTDIIQRDRTKGANLTLKSALDTGKWHSANAQRHIDDVMLFLKLKELGIL